MLLYRFKIAFCYQRCFPLLIGGGSFNFNLGVVVKKKKSVPLAILLNMLLPCIGYFYMGKWFKGILAAFISVIVIVLTMGLGYFFLQIIFSIDMIIISNDIDADNNKLYESNRRSCPNCRESIVIGAKVCVHCKSNLQSKVIGE